TRDGCDPISESGRRDLRESTMTMSRRRDAAEPAPDRAEGTVERRTMALSPGRPRRFHYELENRGSRSAELLVALPCDGPDQMVRSWDVTVPGAGQGSSRPPYERLTRPEALAVTLPPGAGIRVRARVRPWARSLVDARERPPAADPPGARPGLGEILTAAERLYHLRATPLTPLTPDVCAEASAVAGPTGDVVARARRLFDHL